MGGHVQYALMGLLQLALKEAGLVNLHARNNAGKEIIYQQNYGYNCCNV
jgi:hypothetical protein